MSDLSPFDATREARTIVIVAMSARSGSSWLVEQLKQSADFVHFRGELTPFLRRHGLTPVDQVLESEALGATDAARAPQALRDDLTLELGYPTQGIEDAEAFCADILRRLPLQWPHIVVDDRLQTLVSQHVLKCVTSREPFDAVGFTKNLLQSISQNELIDVDFYDLGVEPGPSADQRYPFQTVLESPPLLLFAPWRRATLEDVRTKPLIIKSAGDVYRLDFYQALFPNARLHMLHLRRNPAASINGLINAWLSKKYQSFRVGGLSIRGYSDLAPWRHDWWKLDLFPGWQTYRDSSLAELCAAQWSTAQLAALDWCDRQAHTPFIGRYEDMIASAEVRSAMIERLCDHLAVPRFAIADTRVMNASQQPRRGAWRDRASDIVPLVSQPAMRALSARLGYDPDLETWA